jgi:hypothetical protein
MLCSAGSRMGHGSFANVPDRDPGSYASDEPRGHDGAVEASDFAGKPTLETATLSAPRLPVLLP